MSKALLGIIAVAVVGGGAYFFMNKSTGAPVGSGPTADAGMMQQQQQAPSGTPMSLKELLAGGIAQECTFDDTMAGSPTTGTVYVGGGKVRSDFATTQRGQAMSGHVIVDGDDMYTWIDGMPDGFKINMTAPKPEGTQQSFDVDKKVSYHCEPWTVDESKFVAPQGVTFRDIGAILKGAMPTAR